MAAGYDAMIDTWESWSCLITDDPRDEWCAALAGRLAPGARVVELGCGGGAAETIQLARCFRLTGVDLSDAQLRRARRRVPGAVFIREDLTEVVFDAGSIDAVAAFYVLNHVPRDLLPGLFGCVHDWLAPGGLFLTALGVSDTPAWTGEWLGAPTFFSSYPAGRNRELLCGAGFELLRDELVTIQEPEGPAEFQWVLASKAAPCG